MYYTAALFREGGNSYRLTKWEDDRKEPLEWYLITPGYTCSCPASNPCKHQAILSDLVKKSAGQLAAVSGGGSRSRGLALEGLATVYWEDGQVKETGDA